MGSQRSTAYSLLLFTGVACLIFHQGAAIIDLKKCPKDEPEMTCDVDPCENTECRAHPLAKCSPYKCGGCFAHYYTDGQRVNCDVCLRGGEPSNCGSSNPCDSANPSSGQICVPDYCCGCSARIVDLCADGSAPQGCLFDPCVNLICPEGSQCVSSACGACTAECIDGNGNVVPVGEGEQGKGRGPPAEGRGKGNQGNYAGGGG